MSAPFGSTVIPALGMTFAEGGAKALGLLREFEAFGRANPDADDAPEHLVVEACDIRRVMFTTPPQTPADALAVLDVLADRSAGLAGGDRVQAQETAVALLRDFMATMVG